jgi:putative ABC transport system substrate-binding protein
LLHELVPKAALVALLVGTGTGPDAESSAQAAAHAIGLEIPLLNASTQDKFDAIFATVVRERIDGLLVQTAPVFVNARQRLVELAARHAVPMLYEYRESVTAGGLLSCVF